MFTNTVSEFADLPWSCYIIFIFRQSYTFPVCQAIINSNALSLYNAYWHNTLPLSLSISHTHTHTHTQKHNFISYD